MRFSIDSLPTRARFGAGIAATAIAEEVDRAGLRRVLLVCSGRERPRAERLTRELGDRLVGTFDQVRQHVPLEVAEAGRALAAQLDADGIVSIGGGSATGTAKAIALTLRLPIVAVPTSYAGSEVTPIWGLTTAARKETGYDRGVLPTAVVYDPDLLAELPHEVAVASALNAIAHCVEAFWTPDSNPVTASMASDGLRSLSRGLRGSGDPFDSARRESLLYGSFLAGLSFAAAGSGLHHKICHALGGAFDLPHAELHGVILPHVLEFNLHDAPDAAARVAQALGATDAVSGLDELYDSIGATRTLRALGFDEKELEYAIDVVTAKLPIANPRPVSRSGIATILGAAL
ncbi:maleylacetate reductase [Agreia bicolorata]|uniref:maleylacetate reductase n=1 Tax=Agreia bicolorata TaxID=110935 RepID=UPI0006989E3E|nr:maleylacetate reductase [Agreia bicolorata]